MDDDLLSDLEARYDTRVAHIDTLLPGYRVAYAQLHALLCGPGQLLVPAFDAGDLSAQAELFVAHGTHVPPGTAVTLVEGDAHECHANTVRLWLAGEIDHVVTGFASSADGLWRPHSFGARAGAVIETTVAREAYFGIVCGELAAWVTVAANLDLGALDLGDPAAVAPGRVAVLARVVDRLCSLAEDERDGGESALVAALRAEPALPWPV